MLSDLQKQLLNDYQREFPLTSRPYLAIAQQLGISEDEVLTTFAELTQQNYISRIGAVIPPNHIGASSLVAMAIPPDKLEKIAQHISTYKEVNHNYERENRFNLWFVVVASNTAQLEQVIQKIELTTGYSALRLPLIQDFFIDLGFELNHAN
jgi:DNA-binding Lrp family transcriptional regulator